MATPNEVPRKILENSSENEDEIEPGPNPKWEFRGAMPANMFRKASRMKH